MQCRCKVPRHRTNGTVGALLEESRRMHNCMDRLVSSAMVGNSVYLHADIGDGLFIIVSDDKISGEHRTVFGLVRLLNDE